MSRSPYLKVERLGSAAAHGCAVLLGVPLTLVLLPLPLSLAPCPVVAYLLARWFRRRRLAWGAFQCMQSSLVQLIILILAALAFVVGDYPRVALGLGTLAFLLVLYTLWAAFDTLLGYDFHYIGVSNVLDRVSRANLNRVERRRRWFRGRSSDGDGRGL